MRSLRKQHDHQRRCIQSRYILVLLSVCVASGCVARSKANPKTNPKAMTQPAVLVIGGIHQGHDDAATYTYERMGELFELLEPDILCVEVEQRYLDDGTLRGMPYDFARFMVPAALERGVPLFGIDWWDESRGRRWMDLQREVSRDPRGEAEVELHSAVFTALNDYFEEKDFFEINSAEITDLWAAKSTFKYKVLGQYPEYKEIVAYENDRNQKMVERILEVVRAHPDKSILVAVGIDHKYFIEAALRDNGIRVLDVEELRG